MSLESFVLLLGIIIFTTTFIGIPEVWKFYIFAGAGVLLVFVGYLLRRASYLRRIDKGNGERAADSFVESTPANEEELE